MTRNLLITAVQAAAERDGISFYSGPIYRINSELKEFPALWLHPPKVLEKQGCEEGIITYEVLIEMIGKCPGHNLEQQEQIWQEMENKAIDLCGAIAMDKRVKSVGNLAIAPHESTLTNRGEISVNLKMKVEMPFITHKTESACI